MCLLCTVVGERGMLCWVIQSCPILCDPMDSSPPGSSVCGDSPGEDTRVGCHALLQGIFPIQGSNPGLPHCPWILYHLSHQGSPVEREKQSRYTFLLSSASSSLYPEISCTLFRLISHSPGEWWCPYLQMWAWGLDRWRDFLGVTEQSWDWKSICSQSCALGLIFQLLPDDD